MVTARELIDQASAILLDFDGPVCSVFAGRQAAAVAADLRQHLRGQLRDLGGVARTTDPLEILQAALAQSTELGGEAEALLAAAELQCIAVAEPTPGAHQFIRKMTEQGRALAVVSNNGEQAVQAYLKDHDLAGYVRVVSARTPAVAHLMKPHPHLLTQALQMINIASSEALMIGDSVSDVQAAQACAVPCLGYANRDGKEARLLGAGALAVTDSMRAITGC